MVEGFRKKNSTKLRPIASVDMVAGNQYSSSNVLGEFIGSISKLVFVANVRDFCTVVFGCGKN